MANIGLLSEITAFGMYVFDYLQTHRQQVHSQG